MVNPPAILLYTLSAIGEKTNKLHAIHFLKGPSKVTENWKKQNIFLNTVNHVDIILIPLDCTLKSYTDVGKKKRFVQKFWSKRVFIHVQIFKIKFYDNNLLPIRGVLIPSPRPQQITWLRHWRSANVNDDASLDFAHQRLHKFTPVSPRARRSSCDGC